MFVGSHERPGKHLFNLLGTVQTTLPKMPPGVDGAGPPPSAHGGGPEGAEPDTPRRRHGRALVVRSAAPPPRAPPLPVPAPAHALLAATRALGAAWVRWVQDGHGGGRLQRLSVWVADFGQRSDGLRWLLAARRTQRLAALGGEVLAFADGKLEQVQRTEIGRPVFVILSSAAQRAGPFLRPRTACPGPDWEAGDDTRGESGAGPEQTSVGAEAPAAEAPAAHPALAHAHVPSTPSMARPLAQRARPVLMHRAAPPPQRVVPDAGPRERAPRTGPEELARTGENLFMALSAPLAGARQLLFESIPELSSKEEDDEGPRSAAWEDPLKDLEDDDEALFLAAGLPTRRSQASLSDAELMLAAGLPTGRRQMSRSNSFASSASSLQSAARSDGGGSSTERSLSAWLEAAVPEAPERWDHATGAPPRRDASSEAQSGSVVAWMNRMGGVAVKSPETPPKTDALPLPGTSAQRSPPGVPKLALGRMPAVLRHVEASDSGSVVLRHGATRDRNDTWRSSEADSEDGGSGGWRGLGEQRQAAGAHGNPLMALFGSAGSCMVACPLKADGALCWRCTVYVMSLHLLVLWLQMR